MPWGDLLYSQAKKKLDHRVNTWLQNALQPGQERQTGLVSKREAAQQLTEQLESHRHFLSTGLLRQSEASHFPDAPSGPAQLGLKARHNKMQGSPRLTVH